MGGRKTVIAGGGTATSYVRNIEMLKAADIKRGAFQRPVEKARSIRIARTWDWRYFNEVTIARNGVGDFCVDGQHTLYAMRWLVTNEPKTAKRLGIDLDAIPCSIIHVDSYEDAAAKYTELNSLAKSLGAFDKWVGRREAAEKSVLEAESVIDYHGLKVERNQGVNSIKSVSAIEHVQSEGNLQRVLSIITTAWDPSAFSSEAIKPRTEGAFLKAWSRYLNRRKVVDGTMPDLTDLKKKVATRKIKSRWTSGSDPIVPRTLLSFADQLADEQYAKGSRRSSSGNAHDDIFEAIGRALHGKKVWLSTYSGRS